MASVRMPCTIGKVPAFLMSISSEATPTEAMSKLSTPALASSKLVDGPGEARQVRGFPAHHLGHGGLGAHHELPAPGDRHRVEEDAEVHGRGSSGVITQSSSWRVKSASVADHCGLRTMTLPGQGGSRTVRAPPRTRRGTPAARPRRPRSASSRPLSWSVRTVCSPRPSGAHHHQAPDLLADRSRCDQLEQLAQQAAVEVGGDLGDHVDLHALPVEPLDLVLDVLRRLLEVVEAAARSIRPGISCELPANRPRMSISSRMPT